MAGRSAVIGKVDAFGAAWSGTISQQNEIVVTEDNPWNFQLHADHLDATELDRWVGPRSRPNWLQRLLPSLLGDANTAHASELLRRVSAEGDLTADTLTIEKIKLSKAHAHLALHALHLEVRDAEAQWAGGTVRGGMQAQFSPLPKYEMNALIENVNMTQLPWPPRWGERWSGLAAGKIHLTTAGVGKEDLLKQLAGGGDLKLAKVEFRGWDVELSAESGGPSVGASRWTSGRRGISAERPEAPTRRIPPGSPASENGIGGDHFVWHGWQPHVYSQAANPLRIAYDFPSARITCDRTIGKPSGRGVSRGIRTSATVTERETKYPDLGDNHDSISTGGSGAHAFVCTRNFSPRLVHAGTNPERAIQLKLGGGQKRQSHRLDV